jgi:hypothetical protein
MQWLIPLLVLVDYLESHQDGTKEEIRKQFTVIQETIYQLPVADQIKTYYAISNGYWLFLDKCQKHSEANWVYFTKNLIKTALQLTGLSEEERKKFKNFYFEIDRKENYKFLSAVPGF